MFGMAEKWQKYRVLQVDLLTGSNFAPKKEE